MSGTFGRSNAGNTDGSCANIESASDDYTVTQTGIGDHNFTLTIVGTNASTGQSGNTITGDYTCQSRHRRLHPITETRHESRGSCSQTITGSDEYAEDIGSTGTAHYTHDYRHRRL